MHGKAHNPEPLDEVITEIASILAQGYMRQQKGRQLPSDSENSADNAAQVKESEAFTEKRLDVSGHRSLHSLTS